ncbi:NAD(P)H-dependent glycerol-3-phosphate dehydrogenase [Alkalihalobacillus pseudalcaliphilus]|uniref:NAD(P)H-dependent glycerol-3-phosphate dehydrogenase n=1 Tax=Alkalihalobacillus pseudalcaliphilus TaxID=79884 RepID=UPI00064DF6E3|nr:NAD(P)H-dependent glycerol-3-phosphate dehydrogenase [Alkalihalobacillus pseudalcaliphilus]KMK76454.1 glycerol-3-phosphate dehydrogenase [Alkalihalobacillus pseudalcaliphilus]
MSKVAVIGAGSWGTALAIVLADNGHDVMLWARRQEQIDEINEKHTNQQYLPEIELPKSIVGTTDLREAVAGMEDIVLVVPTKAVRSTVQQLRELLTTKATIVHASKGIEPQTHKRISEMIAEEMADSNKLADIVVLSGPSHAEEVCLRQPTTVTSSSLNIEAAKRVQDLFINQNFRVYTNPDLVGVELGGAIKNIIALTCGLTNGLGFGDNTKAAIMTRGLAEMARLGVALGAKPLTFSGLSGLGDLIVTCTSVHSRNWRCGHMLGQGMTLDEVLEKMGMVVEGVRTTQATHELATKLNVEMPITAALFKVLFENVTPQEAAEELMGRVKKHEVEAISNYTLTDNEY